jgi:acetamidase/formamidase
MVSLCEIVKTGWADDRRNRCWPDLSNGGSTMGLDPDLDEAARLATREMVEYLVAEKGLSRDDAYILCSLAADLRVT